MINLSGYYNPQPTGGIKRGRPKNPLTEKLEKFSSKSKLTSTTKENFLTYLTRSLKKVLKNLNTLQHSHIQILSNSKNHSELQSALQSLNTSNLHSILESSEVYRVETLKSFFQEKEAKIFYTTLINHVLQDNIELSLLNTRLNLRCCLTSVHSNSCKVKWNLLTAYLKNDLISDLSSTSRKRSKASDLLTYS